jgi:hypothetical protein
MTELEAELRRRLLHAYQRRGPSASDRARVQASLQATLAAGVASEPLAAVGKGGLKSFLLSPALTLPSLGLGVGCAIALGVWLTRSPTPSAPCVAPCVSTHATPATKPSAPAAPEPQRSTPPLAVTSSAVTPSPTTTSRAPRKRDAVSTDALAAEAALLHRAHAAYRRGQTGETLALLQEHTAKYPASQLAVERTSLRVLVSCALHRPDEARRIAASLPPGSPVLRGTCVEP